MNSNELRKIIFNTLKVNSIPSPELESGLILAYVLGVKRSDLIIKTFNITDDIFSDATALASRRVLGEPFQYITGHAEFMSLDFKVTQDTLIPRDDTEVLVEYIIKKFKHEKSKVSIMDIGCGSGCIGISLAHYLNSAHVTEVDISKKALAVAKENAKLHTVMDKVKFVECDILKDFPSHEKFDCVVSNPPYIKSDEIKTLEIGVKDFEPLSALDGGDDGLIFYRRITELAKLKSGGILAYEVGINQAEDVKKIMQDFRYKDIEILRDLSGISRVVIGTVL